METDAISWRRLGLAVVLGIAVVQTPAHGQRRDTMNSTPRTFAGQTTRLYDFPGGALEGRTERRPLRTTRLTYPGASSGETPRTLSRRELVGPVTGLSALPEMRRRFNGSATPVDEPDAPPGTPVSIVDPVARRGFVSVHELIGVSGRLIHRNAVGANRDHDFGRRNRVARCRHPPL